MSASLVETAGPRTAAFVVAGVLLLLLIVVALISTPAPGTRTVGGAAVAVDPGADFTSAQIDRAQDLAAQVRPWSIGSLIGGVVVTVLLGFTTWGSLLIQRSAAAVGGSQRPWIELLVGGFVLLLVGRLATLPLDAASRSPRVRIGLITQSWGAWLIDVAKSFGITVVVVLAVAALARALILAFPANWWIPAATGTAALVVALSFVYPVVVEPLFNSFKPMPKGELRSSLIDLAERDGIAVQDVLVADASRRTTAVNAYVSGFGASRRVVVYDTLLERLDDDQVRSVVAHELGHVKDADVRNGTLMGALGAAALVCLLAGLLSVPWILQRVGASSASDPGVLAFVLAVVMLASFVTLPVSGVVSRRIEARADVHALDLTRDPATLVGMQRDLALANISDPDPPRWLYRFVATHPTAPERIALARQWAASNALAVPAPSVKPRKGIG